MARRFLFAVIFLAFSSFVQVSYAGAGISGVLSDNEYSELLMQKARNMIETNAMLKKTSFSRAENNLTMLLLEARKNQDRLTPAALAYFRQIESRPSGLSKTYLETKTNYFKFYYTTTGLNAVSTTDADVDGVPDYVENMADEFAGVLAKYEAAGYARPPIETSVDKDNRYAVYISNPGSGIYGYCQGEYVIGDNPNSPGLTETGSISGFMVMRPNYTGFGSTAELRDISMRVTAAHEFFHAVQFGYGADNMTGYLMEMASTWAEDWVHPGFDDNWQYVNSIFETPDIALDYIDDENMSQYDGHWYADWIFMRYLTDRFGVDLPKLMFEKSVTEFESKAIDDILQTKGISYTTAVKDFYIALGILTQSSSGDIAKYRFSRGDDYRTKTVGSSGPFNVVYEKTLSFSGAPVSYLSSSGNKRLMRLGADYIVINSTTNFNLRLTPTSGAANTSARLIKMDNLLNPSVLSVVEPSVSGNDLVFSVTDKSQYNNCVLIVYNTKYAESYTTRDAASVQYGLTMDAASVPVELSAFTANQDGDKVSLKWATATETNNQGFEVERKINNGNFDRIGFVKGSGNSTESKSYSFTDKLLSSKGVYNYRLKQLNNDGTFCYYNAAGINLSVPSVCELMQNYPNPFNPSTLIKFSLPETQNVRLAVYNITGQEVAVLAEGVMEAGYHEMRFDGKSLGSGIYYCRLVSGSFSAIKKMVLLK